jgi:hypothetical protein
MEPTLVWKCRLRGACAAILLAYGLGCAIAGHGKGKTRLVISEDNAGPSFRPNAVLAYALAVESCAQLYQAWRPAASYRLALMSLSLPALNAAVLVGVLHITSLWAVVLMVGDVLAVLAALGLGNGAARAQACCCTTGAVGLYMAAWIVACVATPEPVTAALVCYSGGAAAVAAGYGMMQTMGASELALEVAGTVGFLGVYVFGNLLWLASETTDLYGALAATVLGVGLLAVAAWRTRPQAPPVVKAPLVDPAPWNDDEEDVVVDPYAIHTHTHA